MLGCSRAIVIGFMALCAANAVGAPLDTVNIGGWDWVVRGDYLNAWTTFKSQAFNANCTIRDPFALQDLHQFEPFITGVPSPHNQPESEWTLPSGELEKIQSSVAHPALKEIVLRAAETRITILNEDHGVPRSRAFAMEVAEALRPLGYKLLALETLDNDVDQARIKANLEKLVADGYPRLSTGFYTADPVYSVFVRKALALGFKPIAYESAAADRSKTPAAQVAFREQGQAENLARVLRDAAPSDKMLIYVGFAHVAEQPMRRKNGERSLWMAARLKALTGIDPLTIDQTNFAHGGAMQPPGIVEKIVAKKVGQRDGILFLQNAPLVVGPFASLVDMQVVHGDEARFRGRPRWLSTGGRKPSRAPESFRPKQGIALIKAYFVQDAKDAVPLDIVAWKAGAPPPTMMLPPGPIRYVSETGPPISTCKG